MKYRELGKAQCAVSVLGFGAMRLPVIDESIVRASGNQLFFPRVDEREAIRMIRYAIDHGVNYIDTAYFYHGGESERVIAKALGDGYRKKAKVATKLPLHLVGSIRDCDRVFNEQLERLESDKVAFYLLHALSSANWSKVCDLGVIAWLDRLLARGKIEHIGFSFHDSFDSFRTIVDAYSNWSLCQLQYNYMDVDYQSGERAVEYAAARGLGIVIMEPLRGGQLTRVPPARISEIWNSAIGKRSLAEWGLQWLWDQEHISVVLSGMSTMEQVTENVALADASVRRKLTDCDKDIVEQVRNAYKGSRPVPCTSCQYCMPCPSGVDIAKVFDMYNDSCMYEDPMYGRLWYNSPYGFNQDQRADRCTRCGDCATRCPQKIAIPDCLERAHSEMALEGRVQPKEVSVG